MDVPEVFDPNTSSSSSRNGGNSHQRNDSAAGSVFGSTNGGSSSRDMVASLADVKPSIREFDGKSKCRRCVINRLAELSLYF